MADKNFRVKNGVETPLIAGSDGTTAITLVGSGDINVAGDLILNGNDIKYSSGSTQITLASGGVVFAGDIQVNGNDIKGSGGTTAISLSTADVSIAGDLTVNGGNILGPGSGSDLTIENASTIQMKNDFTLFSTDAGVTKAYFNNSGSKFTFNGGDADNTNNYNLYSHGTLGSLTDTTVGGTLYLKGSTSGSVGLKGAAVAGSTTYTLPSADGTNGQFLKTNGSAILSWATASGGGSTIPITNSGTISAQPYSLGPGVMAMAGTFATLSATMTQTIRYQPIYVTEACTLTEVAVWQQTGTTLASCTAMIYIDECSPNSATEWQPTGHLSGGYCGEITFSTTGSPVLKTITGLSIVLNPGAYLIAIQISNYTGTLGLRYLAGQVFTGGGYVVDLASGTTTAQTSFGRTGITYVSGTPAAVGDFTNIVPNNLAGQGYIVMTKFAKN